ncbi:MAG TPA: cytochrome c biogenesis CcdA family protein [Syntrophomonadaceae bacterium]|nr:cytochrome c biogenesis CcdA family protein [Syntrophomonadaceae bacterium]
MSFLLCFIEGLLAFVSPCILPLLPVYVFYLAGVSEQSDISHPRLIKNSIAFVVGFTLVFVALGATASLLGQFLQENISVFRKIGGLIMIILGLNFAGVIRLHFLDFDRHLEYRTRNLHFFTSVVFGTVFAFGWTPCVGAFLGSALILAGNTESLWQGITMLLLFSAGLGLPFILFATLFDRAGPLLKTMQNYHRAISIVSGLVLILAGILMYTDKLGYLMIGQIPI